MRHRLVALLAPGLLVVAPLAAQTPDPYETKVRALAHPRYAEREKAARELEAAGEPALNALRAVRTAADEELRARAAAVEARIDRAVRSKQLLAAPALALKFDKVPVEQAVAEVARKTGLPLQLDRGKGFGPNRTVTLDTGEVPFWQAVHAFYQAAGLTEDDRPPSSPVTVYTDLGNGRMSAVQTVTSARAGGRFRLVDATAAGPAATGHALRVRALPASYAHNRYDPEKGLVTTHLAVDHVPALSVQELIGVEVRKATAADGRAVAPAYPPAAPVGLPGFDDGGLARNVIILNGEMRLHAAGGDSYFPVTLKADGERPRLLAELQGVVAARVLAPPEPLLSVADVFGKGKGQPHSANGLTCQVTAAATAAGPMLMDPRLQPAFRGPGPEKPAPAAEAPAGLRLQLASTVDVANEVLNFPVQMRGRQRPFLRINRGVRPLGANMPEFQLKDADGKPIRVISSYVTQSTFDGQTLSQDIQLVFEKPARGFDGITLNVTGRRAVVVELPFVLKDVPLP